MTEEEKKPTVEDIKERRDKLRFEQILHNIRCTTEVICHLRDDLKRYEHKLELEKEEKEVFILELENPEIDGWSAPHIRARILGMSNPAEDQLKDRIVELEDQVKDLQTKLELGAGESR